MEQQSNSKEDTVPLKTTVSRHSRHLEVMVPHGAGSMYQIIVPNNLSIDYYSFLPFSHQGAQGIMYTSAPCHGMLTTTL